MNNRNYKNMNKRVKQTLRTLPSMGIAFVVLGVLIFASSYAFSLKSNFLLFAGLFLVIAGSASYVYTLKKD